MQQSSQFINCKEKGCRGNCSIFKESYRNKRKQETTNEQNDSMFLRITGDKHCWILAKAEE